MPFTCYNRAEVEAAMLAHKPRDIREVLEERYEGCTIDANNRAHAPYDGYEDNETGKLFRAGEYLPEPESFDDPLSTNGFWGRKGGKGYVSATDAVTGEPLWFEGTKAQREAAIEVLKAQGNAALAAQSFHLGFVGEKITVDATIKGLKKMEGAYGVQWFHFMVTPLGSVVIYKGSVKLAEKGSDVVIVAKVKSHTERDGVAQTWVERPALKADVDAKAAATAARQAAAKTPEGKAAKAAEAQRRAEIIAHQEELARQRAATRAWIKEQDDIRYGRKPA